MAEIQRQQLQDQLLFMGFSLTLLSTCRDYHPMIELSAFRSSPDALHHVTLSDQLSTMHLHARGIPTISDAPARKQHDSFQPSVPSRLYPSNLLPENRIQNPRNNYTHPRPPISIPHDTPLPPCQPSTPSRPALVIRSSSFHNPIVRPDVADQLFLGVLEWFDERRGGFGAGGEVKKLELRDQVLGFLDRDFGGGGEGCGRDICCVAEGEDVIIYTFPVSRLEDAKFVICEDSLESL
jgi:hypothetical protein